MVECRLQRILGDVITRCVEAIPVAGSAAKGLSIAGGLHHRHGLAAE